MECGGRRGENGGKRTHHSVLNIFRGSLWEVVREVSPTLAKGIYGRTRAGKESILSGGGITGVGGEASSGRRRTTISQGIRCL